MRPLRGRCGFLRSERGQVLPLVVISAVVLIAFCGLAIDMGRVWVAKQQLQRAVDAATLAAGQDLPDSATALSAAQTFSAYGSSSPNPLTGWGVTANAPNVTFECIKSGPDYTAGSSGGNGTCLTDTSSNSCHPTNTTGSSNSTVPSGATTCNAVLVTETAKVTTGLLSLFIPSFTVKASSTATARQAGVPNPMDLEVILDTTQSMTQTCGATVTGVSNASKLDCAKAGVRTLLLALDPTKDQVGIDVFPAPSMTLGASPGYSLTANATAVADETNCSSTETFSVTYPPWENYTDQVGAVGQIPSSALNFNTTTYPYHDTVGDAYSGYLIVPLANDFQTTSGGVTSLNVSSSKVVQAVDWGETGCTNFPGNDDYGVKDIGGQGSYLAGAITAAQYALGQAPATNSAGQTITKAMIILSDGEFGAPNSGKDGVSPGSSGNVGWSSSIPCQDALNAATQAKNAGTLIFSIAYNSSGNCGPDGTGGYTGTAANLMKQLATTGDFIATSGDLTTAFGQAASQLTGNSQLTPDCAWSTTTTSSTTTTTTSSNC
jgi:hypothetical protein